MMRLPLSAAIFLTGTTLAGRGFAQAPRDAPDAEPPAAQAAPVAPPPPAPPAKPSEPEVVAGAPEGRAAPPTESGRQVVAAGPATVRVGLELFAQYAYRRTAGLGGASTWFHELDVPRAHGAIEAEWSRARGRLVLEAVRSASDGALVGVAGDSLVLRLREAHGRYRLLDWLEVSAGVVPTLTIPQMDGTWMMRAIAASGAEANGLLPPADLGAHVRADVPRGYGWVAGAVYNGEGYTRRELNRGKTTEAAGEVHPFAGTALAPLGVFASYVAGSTGTASVRANRFTGGLVWQGARVRAGAFVTYGWGFAQLGTQEAMVASGFVRTEPLKRVLAGARLDHAVREVSGAPANALTTLWVALGYQVAEPLETFLALTRAIPTSRAQNELPGSNLWELRVIGRVIF